MMTTWEKKIILKRIICLIDSAVKTVAAAYDVNDLWTYKGVQRIS